MGAYREGAERLRVLFCIGVSQRFFDEQSDAVPELIEGIKQAFGGLESRFDVHVLGTMDDDELMVGPSSAWPWTAYILADAPDFGAVTAVCNIVRDAELGRFRLWKYLRIEARVGRPLFFGND